MNFDCSWNKISYSFGREGTFKDERAALGESSVYLPFGARITLTLALSHRGRVEDTPLTPPFGSCNGLKDGIRNCGLGD